MWKGQYSDRLSGDDAAFGSRTATLRTANRPCGALNHPQVVFAPLLVQLGYSRQACNVQINAAGTELLEGSFLTRNFIFMRSSIGTCGAHSCRSIHIGSVTAVVAIVTIAIVSWTGLVIPARHININARLINIPSINSIGSSSSSSRVISRGLCEVVSGDIAE